MQQPRRRVLLVPPDTRPPTFEFPARLAEATGYEVFVPPREALPLLNRPGDLELLAEWLREHAGKTDTLILSLETLALGGVIPARRSSDPLAAAERRLNTIAELKSLNPQLRIFAAGAIVRVSRDDDPFEEKAYFGEYGRELRSYSRAFDRFRQFRAKDDERILQRAIADVPSDILDDWLDSRKRNHQLHLKALELATTGSLDAVCLTTDDSSRYGLAARDRRALEARTDELRLWRKVDIYPGGDEVLVTLLARAMQSQPTIFEARYSGHGGPATELLYEDRCAGELVKAHLRAAGCRLAAPYEPADAVLAVNTPGARQAHTQPDYADVDTPARNLPEFVDFISRRLEEGLPLGVADIAYPNGAEIRLMQLLEDVVPLKRLAGYSAWNTAANTVGSAIAMAVAFSQVKDKAAWTEVLFNRLVDDYLYQAVVRGSVDENLEHPSPFDLGTKKQAAEALIEEHLRPLALDLWDAQFDDGEMELSWRAPHLAWSRLFTGVFPFRVSKRST